jgi:AcrR family transcriptional regulator
MFTPTHLPAVRNIPKQNRSKERLAHILDVTAALVGERGIEHVSTADVALGCNSSIGAVYRVFEDKDQLFVAVAEQNLNAILTQLPKTFSTEDKAAAAVVKVLQDANKTVPSFRQLNVGAQMTDTTRDGWLEVAKLVISRITLDPEMDAKLVAVAISGANTIISTDGISAVRRSAIAQSLVAKALRGEW